MRILLTTLNSKYIHTNLAIRLLYELNKDNADIQWKEFTTKENPDEIANYCRSFDLVALSCYIWNITATLELTKKIKSLNPAVTILLGGPEVSYEYESIISRDDIDYIIAGEGENAFAEFISSFPDVNAVPNLVRNTSEGVISNPHSAQFDLAKLAGIMPYGSDESGTLTNKVLYIETSRGCPYKCGFCLASLDNKVRYLPMESIKRTLLHMMRHGKVIKFLDRTFNIKKDFTIEIFSFILEHHQPGNVFQFEITADILHPDIIRYINEKVPKGLFRFEIGIQTVNQQANLAVSRKQNFDKTRGIILQLDQKVEMHLDLIVGLALDRWTDIKYSFEEVFKLFAPELQLGFLKFLKGTPVRDSYRQHGFEFDQNPPYQIIKSDYLSKEELEKIVKLEHALEIYWNGKKAINTLKYITARYSIFEFLLGLGEFFGTIRDYHRYSLTDIYDILMNFTGSKYPDDIQLKELIAIDYYLHFKVRPQPRFIHEIEKAEKNRIIQAGGLNHSKYRFVILPVTFDYKTYSETLELKQANEPLIIQYDGVEKAKVVEAKPHVMMDAS
jgi:anaerobic magnesium-protoporphyrin IX monomethyl ester cyclase